MSYCGKKKSCGYRSRCGPHSLKGRMPACKCKPRCLVKSQIRVTSSNDVTNNFSNVAPAPSPTNNEGDDCSNIVFVADTGSTQAKTVTTDGMTQCQLQIIGKDDAKNQDNEDISGIITATDNDGIITIEDLRDLSPYVVDSNGGSQFDNLCDAIKAANNDSNPNAVTIFIKPGNYTLCGTSSDPNVNPLASNRKINFFGTSAAGLPGVIITGDALSHGNKGWFGVNFTGTATYNLDSPAMPAPAPAPFLHNPDSVC